MKNAVMLGLLLSSALVLTGCATTPSPEPSSPPAPAPVPTVDARGIPTDFATKTFGDATCMSEVTDDYGSYCHVTVDAKSEALTLNPAVLNAAALAKNGVTLKDAQSAQASAVTFLVEQVLDPPMLDNDLLGSSDWLAANTALLHPDYLANAQTPAFVPPAAQLASTMPRPLLRNGGPRATAIGVTVSHISSPATAVAGDGDLRVTAQVTASFAASDSAIVDAIIRNSSGTAAVETTATLRVKDPLLFDGQDDAWVLLEGTFSVVFRLGDYTHVAADADEWGITTSTGTVVAPYGDSLE